MQTTIQGKGIQLREELKESSEQEVERLGKYYDRILDVDILFEGELHQKQAQLKVHVSGDVLIASEMADSFDVALKQAVDKVIGQLKQYKDKHRNH